MTNREESLAGEHEARRTDRQARQLRLYCVSAEAPLGVLNLPRKVGIVRPTHVLEQLGAAPVVIRLRETAGFSINLSEPFGVGNHLMDDRVNLRFGELLSP